MELKTSKQNGADDGDIDTAALNQKDEMSIA